MSFYCFKNPKTEEIYEEFFESDNIPEYIKRDGVKCERNFRAEWDTQTSTPPGNWPLASTALGVHKSQVKEYEKFARDGGVPTHFNSQSKPVFESKSHRKKYCELVGVGDLDGGTGDPVFKK